MGVLTDRMKVLVEEQRLGFVATICAEGTPNLSPKGTTAVWDDDHLVFADICSPGTIANLRANPALEINVVDVFARKGFRFKSRGEVVSDGPRFEEHSNSISIAEPSWKLAANREQQRNFCPRANRQTAGLARIRPRRKRSAGHQRIKQYFDLVLSRRSSLK